MVESKLVVPNKTGLHARPAALFVQTATKFKSDVKVVKGETEVNAKSIMGIMALAAHQGDELLIKVEGTDETEAMSAIIELFKSNFGE